MVNTERYTFAELSAHVFIVLNSSTREMTVMTTDTTTAKHTPGPWEARGPGTERAWISAGPIDIACTRAVKGHDHAANARLIAAAPELLEAAKKVKQWMYIYGVIDANSPEDTDAWDAVTGAIAKATGQDAKSDT